MSAVGRRRSLSNSRAASTDGRSSSRSRSGDPKSTVFHPVSMSPLARSDIVNHMNSHYRRVHNAKAVVDTSAKRTSSSPCSTRPSSQTRPVSRTPPPLQDHDDIVRTSSRINYYLDALRREQQRLLTQVTSQTAHFRRQASSSAAATAANERRRLPWTDLMEVHAEHFTMPSQPFVPRLLRTSARSRLPEYRWYNPPRRKKPSKTEEEPDTTPTMSDDDDDDSELRLLRAPPPPPVAARPNGLQGRNSRTAPSRKRGVDDEAHYLEFAVDVTNDILTRGIYTNKVLKQVFRFHADKRKHELSADKMETALERLRRDLGIPESADADRAMFGYGQDDDEVGKRRREANGRSDDRPTEESPTRVDDGGSRQEEDEAQRRLAELLLDSGGEDFFNDDRT